MRLLYFFLLFVFLLFAFENCKNASSTQIIIPQQPFQKLSNYHFFKGDLKELIPNERVLPYDLNTSLFSDYAHKARFVWMPEGVVAIPDSMGKLQFQPGSVLIKNFFYLNDERDIAKGRRIIETRLLVLMEDGWDALTYIWNKEQTDATLDIVGDIFDVKWIDKNGQSIEANYIVPNKNQCKGCHEFDGKLVPLGPKAPNLSKKYVYDTGEQNQINKWREMGYYANDGTMQSFSIFPKWDDPNADLHHRAMAYLDVNCGNCHNPKGPANTSGLTLTFNQELDMELGIYKAPVATGKGSGGHLYNIVPGQPEKSIMVYRMESTDPGAMMPELGRRLVHREGVDLIAEWIEKM